MRPYDEYSEDFDDFEEFAYGRSQSLHKLLKAAQREERHRNRNRSLAKARQQIDDWHWDDDDDWDSYLDDSNSDDYGDLIRHY